MNTNDESHAAIAAAMPYRVWKTYQQLRAEASSLPSGTVVQVDAASIVELLDGIAALGGRIAQLERQLKGSA